MSQRSHIAHSGSSAISECSAAWSDDSSSGIASSPSSWCGRGTNQTASVSNVVGGSSSGTVASVAPSAIAFFWYATTCSVTETRPKESSNPHRRSTRSGSSIAVVVSFFACVYQSPSNGSTTARIAWRSSSRTRYWRPRWR